MFVLHIFSCVEVFLDLCASVKQRKDDRWECTTPISWNVSLYMMKILKTSIVANDIYHYVTNCSQCLWHICKPKKNKVASVQFGNTLCVKDQ